MIKRILAITPFIWAATSPPVVSDCKDAGDAYRTASAEVSYTLRRYASCLASSSGQDDCSIEFRRLRNAQFDYETAVNRVRTSCS